MMGIISVVSWNFFLNAGNGNNSFFPSYRWWRCWNQHWCWRSRISKKAVDFFTATYLQVTNVVWFDDFFFEFRKRKFFIIFCFSSRRSSRPSSRESSQRSDRSVSFSKDLKTTKSAAGTAAHKSSKKSEELPPKKSKKERKRPDSRSSRSSSHSRSPTPKRERKKKKRHHHRKRKSDGKMIHFHNSLLHDPVNKVILQKNKISYF